MPRLTKRLPKYRKHSSVNARVTINERDYIPWNGVGLIQQLREDE